MLNSNERKSVMAFYKLFYEQPNSCNTGPYVPGGRRLSAHAKSGTPSTKVSSGTQ